MAAGIKKSDLLVEAWPREVAPSTCLRQWCSHDPAKWEEFRRRYFRELDANPEAWEPLLAAARQGEVTLVYSWHDTEYNDAVVLRGSPMATPKLPGRSVDVSPRRPAARSGSMGQITFWLSPAPPFRLEFTAWALRRRPANAIDRWDGGVYRRVLVVGARPREICVVQDGPRLGVTVRGERLPASTRAAVAATLERMLGLGTDLSAFYRLAAEDGRLGGLARRFRGLKPPRFPTVFEALVNGISCQQLSLAVGLLLLNRLAEVCGLSVGGPGGTSYAFPRPEDVAELRPRVFQRLGYSSAKARAILGVARQIVAGRLDLETLSDLDDETALERLTALPGVGRWTAEYILLRGLGRIHVFPGDDVGARKRLGRWLHLRKALDYERVQRLLRRWRPYAGLIYFHMLLDGLAEAKMLRPATALATARRRTSRRSDAESGDGSRMYRSPIRRS